MGEMTLDRTEPTSVETILRDELARESRALRGIAPVVSHMLENSDHALVSDAIVARLRGMLNSIAVQLLSAGTHPVAAHSADNDAIDSLVGHLSQDSELLNHLYALAMEGQLTQQLEQRSAMDPVLSPLLQELIASDQPATAELAMNTLAAQSRFMQNQRRMQHSIAELPAEMFARAIAVYEGAGLPSSSVASASAQLKGDFDEGAGRLGLLARLTASMHGGAVAALELDHAGLALFVSVLSTLSKQPRDYAIMSCHERQNARLALGLRAAGLDESAIERQFALLAPAHIPTPQLGSVAADQAKELLSDALMGSAL